MKKWLRRFLPGHEAVRDSRWLKPFSGSLLHPDLWHLNRHSAAGAVAVGLACGLIPGPIQMLSAALLALLLRVNLPLALFATLFSNPLTIVPLYLLAFELGRLVLGAADTPFVAPPEMHWPEFTAWASALWHWALGLGKPLGVGLVLLAALLAATGWLAVHFLWRFHLLRNRNERRRRRRNDQNSNDRRKL